MRTQRNKPGQGREPERLGRKGMSDEWWYYRKDPLAIPPLKTKWLKFNLNQSHG